MIEPMDSDVPGAVPAELAEQVATNRRRRWVAPVAVVAALGMGVGGTLAAVQPWQDDTSVAAPDDSDSSTNADASDDADQPAGRPELPVRRFVIDPLPDGYELAWLNDPAELSDEELGMGNATGTTVLLVGADATLSEGPWLSVNVRQLDRFERGGWDPSTMMPTENSRPVRIDEYEGTVGESWDGSSMLVFGPVDDDFAVSMNTEGLTEPQLIAVAASVLVEAGRPRLAAESLPVEMEVLSTADGMYDASPMSMFNRYGAAVSVAYAPGGAAALANGGPTSLTLQHQIAAGDDPLEVARFLFSDPTDAEVGGLPAVTGGLDAFSGFGSRSITWIDEGEALTLIYNGDDDLDLLTVAASVGQATDEMWDALQDEAEENQREMEAVFANPPDAWFIGAGDLDDSTTWLVEGGFTDQGVFMPSISEMTSNGSSFGAGGAPFTDSPTELPAVLVQSSGGSAQVVMALGPLDPAGVVLRVTLGDAAVTEVPLRTVRPDWPASAAALGIPAESEGTAELVAADGSVLASAAINQTDNGNVGSATEDTVAAVTQATVAAASD